MRSGFAHFDGAHRENFCAAVLLFAMEADDSVKRRVAGAVCTALGINEAVEVAAMGREARLAASADDEYARVDIWLLLRERGGSFYVFLEVKTHDRWDPCAVAEQVADQAARRQLARTSHSIRGSVLLAPARLCERVRRFRPVPSISWATLLRSLRDNAGENQLTQHALKHLEEHVDRPIGIQHGQAVDFEAAATTVACLRAFLLGCIADIGGSEATRFNTTPGDGEPLRSNGWAWHGFSVSFRVDGERCRLGIYKYVEAPRGEEDALATLWMEAYAQDDQEPIAYFPFTATTLAADDLEALRERFRAEWAIRRGARTPAQTSAT